jgi:asparagine synthase (glutamine-hydrolysing)
MCGLTGFVDYSKTSAEYILKAMNLALEHRGPNDDGASFYETPSYQLGLAHKRLSIMDLSAHGHQPMSYKNLEIIYNGEVYNFKEIRSELIELGYSFDSDSDTEVILKSFHCWNDKAVDKFHGMFAFVIYDREFQTLKIFRDRAGVKPLYWYFNQGILLFSSELKSFHKHPSFKKTLDNDALAKYLQYGYIPQPHTIFKSAYKLKAGHFLTVDLKKQTVQESLYWDVVNFYNKERLDITYDEAIKHTDSLLHKAFNYRMVSDVPVGIFLSGGYDSVAVASILQSDHKQKLKTFTIGFEDQGFDEAPYAKAISKHIGTEHVEHYCTQQDALKIIPTLSEIYDEPFGDVSAIPTILVSQMAKKEVTVALSADGGDEIFAGYGKYQRALKYEKYADMNFASKKLGSLVLNSVKGLNVLGFNKTEQITRVNDIINKDPNESLLKHLVFPNTSTVADLLIKKPTDIFTYFDMGASLANHNDELSKMLAVDYKTYMVDDVLVKVDRAGMSVSLEGREPLLDHSIIEFAAQLPSNFKLREGNTKDILKNIVHNYVPKHMVDRPKMGFGVPIHHWLSNDLKSLIEQYLENDRVHREGVFQVEKIRELKIQFSKKPQNRQLAKLLWYILVFQMWFEKWMV